MIEVIHVTRHRGQFGRGVQLLERPRTRLSNARPFRGGFRQMAAHLPELVRHLILAKALGQQLARRAHDAVETLGVQPYRVELRERRRRAGAVASGRSAGAFAATAAPATIPSSVSMASSA